MSERLWLVFAQTVTVAAALLFTLSVLRPAWLGVASLPVATPPQASGPTLAPAATAPPTPPAATRAGPIAALSFADAAARAIPSVVNIVSEDASAGGDWRLPDGTPPPTDPDGSPLSSLGSGVIVDASGLILTNSHVVDSSNRHELLMPDGRRIGARLLGTDPETDLALLQADQGDMTAIAWRDEALPPQVGDLVLAIGNPFGVGQTVTMGIISALGRDRLGINTFENFIQTDAAINPGNSGGALVDASGQLIGINTAIYSRSGGSLGIGFAIPIATARNVINQLREHGTVVRGFIGVEPQDITPELARAFALPREAGAVIAGIVAGGPADLAGVQVGDIVLSVQDQPVPGTSRLLDLVAGLKPGSVASFTLLRQGQPVEITISIGTRPPA